MKTKQVILPVLALSLLASCGEYSKTPVTDLESYREQSRILIQQGPDTPRVVTNDVLRKEYIYITKEESTIDDRFISIITPSDTSFIEGQEGSIRIETRALDKSIEFSLSSQNLPDGATLVKSKTEAGVYHIVWTPDLYTATTGRKTFPVKLVTNVTKANSAEELEKLKGLIREKTINLDVIKSDQSPSDLVVTGLPKEVDSDTLTAFTVIVKVPGTDQRAPKKPSITYTYGSAPNSTSASYIERDGSRHVTGDMTKKEPEYIGDSKWKFSLIFDTKNIYAQDQLNKDGSVNQGSLSTNVRMSFTVFSPNGGSTGENLVQLKINQKQPLDVPRFDLSGLNQQALEAAPGQVFFIDFDVLNTNKAARTKVEQLSTNLAGSPKVNCNDSAEGAYKQSCTLTWTVPCSAKSLRGEIPMTAYSIIDGRNTGVKAQAIKVVQNPNKTEFCAKTEVK